MIQLRHYKQEDYQQLAGWAEVHGTPFPHPSALPPLGVVAFDNEAHLDRAAVFAYMDNGGSGVAFMEWLVAAPGNSPMQTREAIAAMVDFASEHLLEMGYSILLGTVRSPIIAGEAKRHGFVTVGENMITMMKQLEPEVA